MRNLRWATRESEVDVLMDEGQLVHLIQVSTCILVLLQVTQLLLFLLISIIGRFAFTGSHQWILLNNLTKDAYPLEITRNSYTSREKHNPQEQATINSIIVAR
ncbi:hypothetical protein Fmac_017994 [Flemingia macrophylla]|uniref:Uncharacterized protein n=1 Tax=Flemingia macrophylla TaxID=520843 RepID=A0ABD1M3N7_9FABA